MGYNRSGTKRRARLKRRRHEEARLAAKAGEQAQSAAAHKTAKAAATAGK
jgi:hypothetical protein